MVAMLEVTEVNGKVSVAVRADWKPPVNPGPLRKEVAKVPLSTDEAQLPLERLRMLWERKALDAQARK